MVCIREFLVYLIEGRRSSLGGRIALLTLATRLIVEGAPEAESRDFDVVVAASILWQKDIGNTGA